MISKNDFYNFRLVKSNFKDNRFRKIDFYGKSIFVKNRFTFIVDYVKRLLKIMTHKALKMQELPIRFKFTKKYRKLLFSVPRGTSGLILRDAIIGPGWVIK